MISINKPAFNNIDILKKCVGAYPSATLNNAISHFQKIYGSYDQLMTQGEGYKIDASQELENLDKKFMLKLYKEQFASKKGGCREEYDKILASAPRQKCPMCSESIVTALDHHFPKSSYFLYSIYPNNLVPICSRCNGEKKHTKPDAVTKQFIHPYYDDFSKEQWFEVRFISQNPIKLIYECKENDHLGEDASNKLKSHFKRLKLADLYTSNAIVKLGDLKNIFRPLLKTKDWFSVCEELKTERDMVSGRPDSWEYALFEKLIKEDWYIKGGFVNID